MVDVTPPVPAGRQIIQSYGNGGFRIGGMRHEGSVLVVPERTISWDAITPDDISIESLSALFSPELDVKLLLVGCGSRSAMLAPAVRKRLRDMGVSVETMDTGAACRTFNVLLAEFRPVAAALIAVD